MEIQESVQYLEIKIKSADSIFGILIHKETGDIHYWASHRGTGTQSSYGILPKNITNSFYEKMMEIYNVRKSKNTSS